VFLVLSQVHHRMSSSISSSSFNSVSDTRPKSTVAVGLDATELVQAAQRVEEQLQLAVRGELSPHVMQEVCFHWFMLNND